MSSYLVRLRGVFFKTLKPTTTSSTIPEILPPTSTATTTTTSTIPEILPPTSTATTTTTSTIPEILPPTSTATTTTTTTSTIPEILPPTSTATTTTSSTIPEILPPTSTAATTTSTIPEILPPTSLGRLRGIFVKTPKPTTIATTTSTIPKILPPTSTATTTTTTPNSKTAVMVTNIVKQFKKNSRSDSFRRNSNKYEATVRRLIAGKHFSAIETILEHQRKYKESMSEETFAVRLISLYGKAKMFKNARKLFDDMPSLGVNRTVISFNALLYAYVNSKKYDEIAEIFKEMPAISSIEPDIVSYNTMIKAFCEMGALDSAVTIMDKMEKNGITPDLISYNTILDKYYKSNKFSEAEKLWSVMKEKNIVPNARTYNPKLRGLVQNGRVLEAVELIKEMEENEVKPDVFSYNSVIKGFVDEGNLEEVKKWYEKIEENGLIPDYVTFGMLIPFVRGKGDFSYVFGLCKRIIELKMHILYAEIQKVVDGLIEKSLVEEAKELVELANSSKIYRNKLKMKIIE